MSLLKSILAVYPNAVDCLEGHIGLSQEHIEQEIDDDRSYTIKIRRCNHCNMPTGGGEYV